MAVSTENEAASMVLAASPAHYSSFRVRRDFPSFPRLPLSCLHLEAAIAPQVTSLHTLGSRLLETNRLSKTQFSDVPISHRLAYPEERFERRFRRDCDTRSVRVGPRSRRRGQGLTRWSSAMHDLSARLAYLYSLSPIGSSFSIIRIDYRVLCDLLRGLL